MEKFLQDAIELFRTALHNRNEYLIGLHPEVNPKMAETNFWKYGASFHLGAATITLQYQIQPPHIGALDDWMLTISILDVRLSDEGKVLDAHPAIDDSLRYKPTIKDGVHGWVDHDSGEGFTVSKDLAERWDERFMDRLFPKFEV